MAPLIISISSFDPSLKSSKTPSDRSVVFILYMIGTGGTKETKFVFFLPGASPGVFRDFLLEVFLDKLPAPAWSQTVSGKWQGRPIFG